MSITRRQTLLGALAGFLKPILPKSFPVPRFIRAPRFNIPFYTVSCEKFEKVTQVLQPMEIPNLKLLEMNMVSQFQEKADEGFLRRIEDTLPLKIGQRYIGGTCEDES